MCDFHSICVRTDGAIAHLPSNSHSGAVEAAKWRETRNRNHKTSDQMNTTKSERLRRLINAPQPEGAEELSWEREAEFDREQQARDAEEEPCT